MDKTGPDRNGGAATLNEDLVGLGMAQWRRERADIDCSGKAVVGRILLLQGIILKAVDAVLAPHGLRYPAYAVLRQASLTDSHHRNCKRRCSSPPAAFPT
jgi:hypothetical protein